MTTATASVTLSTVWINLASTLSNYQSFPLMSALEVDTNQPGEVRTYAGGRLRLVTTAGVSVRQCLSAMIVVAKFGELSSALKSLKTNTTRQVMSH